MIEIFPDYKVYTFTDFLQKPNKPGILPGIRGQVIRLAYDGLMGKCKSV